MQPFLRQTRRHRAAGDQPRRLDIIGDGLPTRCSDGRWYSPVMTHGTRVDVAAAPTLPPLREIR